jgi:flagellar biogenesis protein FliO
MYQKGLTIIQLMLVLLFVGLLGAYVVERLIDKRCESAPSKTLCDNRAN